MLRELAGDAWVRALLQSLAQADVPGLERASILLQKLSHTRCHVRGVGVAVTPAGLAGRGWTGTAAGWLPNAHWPHTHSTHFWR